MPHRRLPCFMLLLACAAAHAAETADAGSPFGELPLLDEVRCGEANDPHPFAELPEGASRIETILGRPCRVMPNAGASRYFAYQIGKGKGLKAGAAYVLSIEYPEDTPRNMFFVHRGAELARGIATGEAIPDTLYGYTDNNAESLPIPLSQAYRAWKVYFHLHERFPALELARDAAKRPMTPPDGFWVIVTQAEAKSAPRSAGAAVARIRLFEVPDPARVHVKPNLPPKDLPRRRLCWREEMADGVLAGKKNPEPGVANDADWYEHKARLMQVLGMNAFTKDLLEFSHNQGWDTAPHGGDDWYWSDHRDRWEKILTMLKKYPFEVLPYYEWSGGVGRKGLGKERRCKTLGGEDTYTHITWSEKSSADLTDPDFLTDAENLLDATIVRFKDRVPFAGAWFRPRPSQNPISFSDRCLGLFAKEARGGAAVTREQLKGDKKLLEDYYAWWFGKRREFLVKLRDWMKAQIGPDALLLYTCHSGEPVPALPGGRQVVAADPAAWAKVLTASGPEKVGAVAWDAVVKDGRYLKTLLAPHGTWGKWEWHHACPQADPRRYAKDDGILMTYPFNRAYTVASPEAFAAFRGPAGLALVRHYPLNENTMDKSLGYFVADVERPGPYCMLEEARAVAHGDPTLIAYLASSSFNRGFPEYARAFNAAFLALPALPSQVLEQGATDPEVVVRVIETKAHGTYLAVVNTGLDAKKSVALRLPRGGALTDLVTGQPVPTLNTQATLDFYPCELKALRLE
ncbi:MAG: hypothetical protein M5U26_07990 [Planctomycetota bacterium]|nr:hypothetical protein [Planctomycetota bacterium]